MKLAILMCIIIWQIAILQAKDRNQFGKGSLVISKADNSKTQYKLAIYYRVEIDLKKAVQVCQSW